MLITTPSLARVLMDTLLPEPTVRNVNATDPKIVQHINQNAPWMESAWIHAMVCAAKTQFVISISGSRCVRVQMEWEAIYTSIARWLKKFYQTHAILTLALKMPNVKLVWITIIQPFSHIDRVYQVSSATATTFAASMIIKSQIEQWLFGWWNMQQKCLNWSLHRKMWCKCNLSSQTTPICLWLSERLPWKSFRVLSS